MTNCWNWDNATGSRPDKTSLTLDQPVRGKHNHSNTPKSMTFQGQAHITVTDPCHPLYDRTFPLLYLTNQRELEPCCLVELAPGLERLIPIRQTSLSESTRIVFASPFDPSSVQDLIRVFARIAAQVEKENCIDSGECPPARRHPARASVADLGPDPAADFPASDDPAVPTDDRNPGRGGKA